jgi:hypothetical protein
LPIALAPIADGAAVNQYDRGKASTGASGAVRGAMTTVDQRPLHLSYN